jgi:hypothetical protein
MLVHSIRLEPAPGSANAVLITVVSDFGEKTVVMPGDRGEDWLAVAALRCLQVHAEVLANYASRKDAAARRQETLARYLNPQEDFFAEPFLSAEKSTGDTKANGKTEELYPQVAFWGTPAKRRRMKGRSSLT